MRWRRVLSAALMVAALAIALAEGRIFLATLIVGMQLLLFMLPDRRRR